MPPYERDPISTWFDRAAEDWLSRAYRHPGKWEITYLAPPTPARRVMARQLGETDLDKVDRWGERRWTRAYKRAVFWNHKEYGYGEGLRMGDPRVSDTAGTGLRWETGGLIRKSGWPTRRLELRIMVVDANAAYAAAGQRPATRRYDLSDSYRSKPGPPDRPWDGG